MYTVELETLLEAAKILRQSNWTYEYCHGETVRESAINVHISQIEKGLSASTMEDLLQKITLELDRSDIDHLDLTDANAIAKFVAHDIALFFVEDYNFETVTFSIC